MAVKLGKSLILTNILDVIPISFEHDLVKIEAPRAFWDKSLNDLQLRKKYHVNLIGIIQRDETGEEKELIILFPVRIPSSGKIITSLLWERKKT